MTGGAAFADSVFGYVSPGTIYRVVHTFNCATDGKTANRLVADRSGILYGTATYCGVGVNTGTLWKLDPVTGAFAVLHTFSGGRDGGFPASAPSIDGTGTLYGMTQQYGYGTIYRYTPKDGALVTLHRFNGNDGFYPRAEILLDPPTGPAKTIYSTLPFGGKYNHGTIYSFDIPSRRLTTLHDFDGANDGDYPNGVNFDATRTKLLGTAQAGGTLGYGTVFSLDLTSKTFDVLHSFRGGTDGAEPKSDVVLDKAGVIYGATHLGGPSDAGTLFRLDPVTLAFKAVYAFTNGQDGGHPGDEQILFGTDGIRTSLIGTTTTGGTSGIGTAFVFDLQTHYLTILRAFAGENEAVPNCGMMRLPLRHAFYGTTSGSDDRHGGTVYEILH